MSDPLLHPDRPVDGEEMLRNPRGGRKSRELPRGVAAGVIAVVALVLVLLIAARPSGYLAGRPGPVFDLSAQLQDGTHDTKGDARWLLLTVGYEEISWGELLWHRVVGGDRLVLGPGQFEAVLLRQAGEQMAQSRTDAGEVASALLGRSVAVPESLDLASVGGGSGGLALTLALVDLYSTGDLTGGRVVAATGTIDHTGQVGAVGGVAYKAQAAVDAGADILFVPRANARSVPEGLPASVVTVDDIDDAIAWLCANGGVAEVC